MIATIIKQGKIVSTKELSLTFCIEQQSLLVPAEEKVIAVYK